MIPWLLVIQLMSDTQQSLAQLVEGFASAFPASGKSIDKYQSACVFERIKEKYAASALEVCELDGLSCAFDTWL